MKYSFYLFFWLLSILERFKLCTFFRILWPFCTESQLKVVIPCQIKTKQGRNFLLGKFIILVSKNQYTKFHENLRDVMCRPLPDFILDSLLKSRRMKTKQSAMKLSQIRQRIELCMKNIILRFEVNLRNLLFFSWQFNPYSYFKGSTKVPSYWALETIGY
jgi:hypothetical protein